jgi:hypothetical protein
MSYTLQNQKVGGQSSGLCVTQKRKKEIVAITRSYMNSGDI